jgi:hypothetical protein
MTEKLMITELRGSVYALVLFDVAEEIKLDELRRMNHALTPVSDYFRSARLNLLPATTVFAPAGLAEGYAAMTSRGVR